MNTGKTASEILFEHGIDTMSLNDDFNSQLFAAMERYAEQFLPTEQAAEQDRWIAVSRLDELLSHEYAVRDFAIRADSMVQQHRANAKIELLQKLISEVPPAPTAPDKEKE